MLPPVYVSLERIGVFQQVCQPFVRRGGIDIVEATEQRSIPPLGRRAVARSLIQSGNDQPVVGARIDR